MEVVGVGFGGREVFVGEVSYVRTYLPLPFSMVKSPLLGLEIASMYLLVAMVLE